MKIARSDDLLVRCAGLAGPLLRQLSRVEGVLLGVHLQDIDIDRPVFVCGLARAGSTVLLQLLASLGGVATHRYRDFPFVTTPLIWNAILDHQPQRSQAREPVERPHRDRIRITPESPEAFEEPIWQAFFPDCHEPGGRQRLTAADVTLRFDRFYRDHLRKILHLRRGRRYVSKGNYNVTRIECLSGMFPDARFVIPVRDPLTHVPSLVRQHRLFTEYSNEDPRVPRMLAASGHYEFGPQRIPIEVTPGTAERTRDFWDTGEEEAGYALQWAEVYRLVSELVRTKPELAARLLIVCFEELCSRPNDVLQEIVRHTGLEGTMTPQTQQLLEEIAPPPSPPPLLPKQQETIMSIAGEAARYFRYGDPGTVPNTSLSPD